ncbi:MAG: multicopper oxidase domain-containing protein [Rothia sp. (in: high G+C Gram-positive bacteria)]|uniref:multicopper oxidase domain-containing protein n=1 Tax=Rothia sp. (in: high G+C Gram-positive bacteria) TaxID=1885016 RepID=UPI00270EBDB4|nr:multicopper oxidase domain-containing protein [Rothia sp. (in: high G+C Gram-positive bacteria)]
MPEKDAAPQPGYREQLTLGARPLDAPGAPVTDQQARDIASGRRTWHRKASKPVSVWMFALFIVLMTHRWIPESLWLMVHMVTLGLITNSILVWSQHFTEALLKHKLPDSARPVQLARIYTLNASMVVLMVGVVFSLYPLTVLGSVGVGAVVTWHGVALLQQMRTALPARFGVTIRYYIAASWLLPVGATFGALLAYDGLNASWHGRLLLAHEAVNLLGFVGITVVGTLMTLWPTMLRTVMVPDAVARSTRALAGLCAGLGLIVAGALTGLTWLAVAGLLLYAAALALVLALMVRTTTAKKPSDYATFSAAAGMAWLTVGVLFSAYLVATSPFDALTLRPVTPIFVAGFLAQTLLGAMTYLLPARMGGGPKAVRAANTEFNRFAAGRATMVNLSLLIFILPVSLTGSWVRTGASLLGAFTLFAFIPLMLRGVRASVSVRKAMIQARARGEAPTPDPQALTPVPAPHLRNALIGALAVALVLALGVALDPAARARLTAGASAASATGQTTTLAVEATADMRFTPDTVEVPAGNRLVIEVTNTDTKNAHDLTFANGATTGRIDPGATKTVDVGVITGDLEGWCSVVGHQAMGMTFTVVASGADATQAGSSDSSGSAHAGHSTSSSTLVSSDIDLQGDIADDYQTRDAALAPVPEGETVDGRTVHRQTLDVQELPREIAPGVTLNAWTFNGSYMGPTLRGRVGDIFEITLVNNGSMGHSVDFHAGTVSPDEVMHTIAPGESLTYRFEAVRSGIWLYHCSTMPMSAHLAAGMFGAVIIDPADLPEVDREYLLVQSEVALTEATGSQNPSTQPSEGVLTDISPEGLAAGTPTLTLFNGHATQYLRDPLTARAGERVRIWVLNAGPNGELSFHVVGSQFDTVYKEGGYLLQGGVDAFGTNGGGAQALDLSAAQGGFVEMVFEEPGTYTFVNHNFAAAERGARGQITVTGS